MRRRFSVRVFFLCATLFAKTTSGQDTTNSGFEDNLLDQFVGKWIVSGVVHGMPSQQSMEGEWILNHQFLRITQKSKENVAGTNYPFEAIYYIGKNSQKRYTVQLMTIFGADNSGFGYGKRNGNDFTFILKDGNASIIEKFSLDQQTHSWHILNWIEENGKAEKPYIDLTAKIVGR